MKTAVLNESAVSTVLSHPITLVFGIVVLIFIMIELVKFVKEIK